MPSLLAVLGLDGSGFQQGLSQAENLANRAGGRIISSLSVPISRALKGFAVALAAEKLMDEAERISELSREFRVGADTIQRWEIAAHKAGMSAEDLGNALNKLKRSRAQAVESGELGGFEKFQIPMEALRDAAISTEDVLNRMKEVAGENITDAQDVAGMELMGKSGAKVLSALKELHELGPVNVIDPRAVAEMHKTGEFFGGLKRGAKSLGADLLAGILFLPNLLGGEAAKSLKIFKQSLPGAYEAKLADDILSQTNPKFRGPMETGPTPKELAKQQAEAAAKARREQEEFLRLDEQLVESVFQNKLKTLSVDERRAALAAEIAKHEREAATLFAAKRPTEAMKELLEVEKLRGRMEEQRKDSPLHHRRQADVNALQRIGAFARGENDMAGAVGRIEKLVAKIAVKENHERRDRHSGF